MMGLRGLPAETSFAASSFAAEDLNFLVEELGVGLLFFLLCFFGAILIVLCLTNRFVFRLVLLLRLVMCAPVGAACSGWCWHQLEQRTVGHDITESSFWKY